ncbi:MAG: GEVED domain-containing protein, partial [Bacteroidales bacterium]
MITLDAGFTWDGVSNLVINTCTGLNDFISPYGGLRYTAATSGMITYIRTDGSDNCAATSLASTTYKPNIMFAYSGGSACAGTPAPGNTLSSANPACSGTFFSLSLQNPTAGSGVTYQWQSSPDGLTWTNAGTNATYSTSQTVATWYQCLVTCSGSTGISTPIQVTMSSFLNCYCPSAATSSGDEDITNVTFGNTLNNTSVCASLTGTQGTATGTANLYSNFNAITPTQITQSLTIPISVQVTECGGSAYSHDVRVYIDFNQNGSFSDAGEEFIIWAYASSNTHTIAANITVPVTAHLGVTGMRVVCKESSTTGPCLASSYGETEDYLVEILAATLPAISTLPNNLNLGYAISGSTSAEKSYILTGINLTPADGSITVTPPANFEIGDKQGGPYSSAPISVAYSGSTLGTTPIYVVFKPTTPDLAYSGNISNAGGGAPTANVAVSGTSLLIYCTSMASNTGDEEIYSVTVNGATNAYDCATAAPGPGSILNRYSNFLPLGPLTSLIPGSTASFTILEDECDGATYYGNGCAIWIDFNQNGVFTDAGEQVYSEAATTVSPRTITGSITVPSGAMVGQTLMRVTVAEGYSGATLTSCFAYGYGETEDYYVTIAPPADHDAGTASIDGVASQVGAGIAISPKATVQNYGLNPEVFNVTMTITGGYTSTVTGVSLAAGASTQVTFASWTPAVGNYTVQVCTQLVGDLVPSNDCKTKAVSAFPGVWSSGSAIPVGTYMGASVGYTDNSVSPPVGYLFSFGGNSTLGTECSKYNETTNTWTAIASLPAKRIVVASAQVGNYIYVIGGSDGVAYFNTVFRYDITADTWTTMTSTLPKTIAWGKAVAYGSNYIYLAGGVDAFTGGLVLSDVYVYDIAADTWSAATSMPGVVFGGAFSRTGDKLVYVAGADDLVISSKVYVGTIDGINPATITWATAKSSYPGTTGEPSKEFVEDMAGTTAVHSGILNSNRVAYPGGAMYRFDGAPWGTDGIIVAAGSPTASWVPAVPNPCYVFYPATDTWEAKPNVPVAVLGAGTGSVDLDNAGTHTWKLIVASGYTGTVVSTATQILTETFSHALPLGVTGVAADVTGCFGNLNGSITTTVTGGTAPFAYTWSNGATTASLTGIGAGTYAVTVTDAASGTATAGPWVIAQPSEVVLSATTVNANCPAVTNGSIDLSVTGGTPAYTYLWSNAAITQDLSGLAAGTYTVVVTDANGCTKTGSWAVGLANPVCDNITVTGTIGTTVCYNATTTITVAGGVTTFTVLAPNGNATFFSGTNILFEPGTTVQSGAIMHAYISNTYCLNPSSPITAAVT